MRTQEINADYTQNLDAIRAYFGDRRALRKADVEHYLGISQISASKWWASCRITTRFITPETFALLLSGVPR